MKERYHRPVIAFAWVSEDELKGSARSVPDLNIRDVLAAIDRDHPGLITNLVVMLWLLVKHASKVFRCFS